MADDKKLNIKIEAEADMAAAEDASKSIKQVVTEAEALNQTRDDSVASAKEEVAATARVIDANAKNTEQIKKQREEFTKWQAERDAARKANAGGSSLASDPAEFLGGEAAANSLKDYGIEAERAKEIVEGLTEAELAQAKAAADVAREVGTAGVAQAKAAREAEQHAQKLDKIEDSSRKLVAVELSRILQEVGSSFKGISPEMDQAINGLGNFLGVFASTGDPIKATLALIVGEIGNMVKATIEYDAYMQETKTRQVEALAAIRDGRAQLVQQIRSENLAKFFDIETQALDRQIAAIERKARVDQARRDAEAAATAAGRSISANAAAGDGQSANPQVRAAEENMANLTKKLVELNAALKTQEDLVTLAEKQASIAAGKASAFSTFQGMDNTGSPEYMAAEKQAEAAKNALADAEAALIDFKQINEFQKDQVISEAMKSFDNLKAQMPGALATEASAVIAELERVAKEQGGELSATARAGYESLKTILADGIIKPQEVDAVRTVVAQVNASNEAYGNTILSGFQKVVADNLSIKSKLDDVFKRLDEGKATQ